MSESAKMSDPIVSFWTWFFSGTGGKPGFQRVFNKWIFIHLSIGILLSKIITSIGSTSKDALIPMISVFIGLTFSWAGNVNSLLQSEKIIEMSKNKNGGIYEYVYTFQLCIFIMITAIGAWTAAAMQLPYPKLMNFIDYDTFDLMSKIFLLSALSLTLRTCWQTIVGANFLLLSQIFLPGKLPESSSPKENNPQDHSSPAKP
jgi:hypothetical protein